MGTGRRIARRAWTILSLILPAFPLLAAPQPPSCANLEECVSELRRRPQDQKLRDRVIEMTLQASSGTIAASSVRPSSGALAVLERFKKLASGDYPSAYLCGRYTQAIAMQRRERMGCDRSELEAGLWRRYYPLGRFSFRFPKDGTIEFWNLMGFGYGNLLEMVGTPRGKTIGEIDWRRCGHRGRGRCETPVWVRLSADLGTVTVSPDRPEGEALFDPKTRYSYKQYRR